MSKNPVATLGFPDILIVPFAGVGRGENGPVCIESMRLVALKRRAGGLQ
jgi:hypothetical protein